MTVSEPMVTYTLHYEWLLVTVLQTITFSRSHSNKFYSSRLLRETVRCGARSGGWVESLQRILAVEYYYCCWYSTIVVGRGEVTQMLLPSPQWKREHSTNSQHIAHLCHLELLTIVYNECHRRNDAQHHDPSSRMERKRVTTLPKVCNSHYFSMLCTKTETKFGKQSRVGSIDQPS